MKAVICEDEDYWCDDLNRAVSKWATSRRIVLECCRCVTSQELISHLNGNYDIDVLFLDIALGEEILDGMELAKQVRKMGFMTPIIFVTSNAFRAADGYLVEAIGYLHKPIDEEKLTLFLDRIYKGIKGQTIIKIMDAAGCLTSIITKDIIYAEVCNHTITYHTIQRSFSYRGTFSEILENLRGDNFVQIHRSFVVALDKIDNIKTKYPYSVDVIKENKIINLPVSRKYIDNLLEVYSDDLLEKMI